ncbi:MAG: S-layer homology domain-containing protein [Chloroflexota bacterium]
MSKSAAGWGIWIIGGILLVLAFGPYITQGAPVNAEASPPAVMGGATATPTCTPIWRVVHGPDVGEGDLRDVAAVAADDVWMVGYTGGTSGDPLIMHWDGAQVSNVPYPTPGADTTLESISAVSANDIWVVGDYGYSHMLTLHWDGSTWTAVPNPEPGGSGFKALFGVEAISSNDVWAVGTYYGNDNHGVIMHWDGIQWSVVDEALLAPSLVFSGVSAASANDVWAVGFSSATGSIVSAMWHWDGSSWTNKSNINVWGLDDVDVLSSNDAWAVGGLEIIHWNGVGWLPVASGGLGGGLNGISAIAANDVWAVGNDIVHWNGTQWTRVLYISGYLNQLAPLAAGDIWAVGDYYSGDRHVPLIENYSCNIPPTPTPVPPTSTPTPIIDTPTSTPTAVACQVGWNIIPGNDLTVEGVDAVSSDDVWAVGSGLAGSIEHWNGVFWNMVSSPNPGTLKSVAVVSSDDIWAVGYHTTPNAAQTTAMHWDGTQWSLVPTPNVGEASTFLLSVSAVSSNDVWAVGYSGNETVTMRWDGSTWTMVASPNPGSLGNNLQSVSAIAANDVWAVGSYLGGVDSPGGMVSHTLTMHWDGSAWNTVPSPDGSTLSSYLTGVSAIAANDVWVVGNYRTGSSAYQPLTEHWDGMQWNLVQTPGIGFFNVLSGVSAASSTDVWAVGNYVIPGDYHYHTLTLRWNGTAWSIVPSPNVGALDNTLVAVAAVAPGEAWAVGQYSANDGYHPLTMKYSEVCPTPLPVTPTVTYKATPTQSAPTASVTAVSTVTGTPQATATPCTISFNDVQTADYFYEPVRYLYCKGVIAGYPDGTFRPYNDATRGQISKIVVRATGMPINTQGGPHFTDVPAANPFYEYIETAYNAHVLSGYPDGTFRWSNNITRGQLSKIVVNAKGWSIDTTGGPHFSDVQPGSTFYGYIETAYNHSLISGYPDGTFGPGNPATRGQIAKIVYLAVAPP